MDNVPKRDERDVTMDEMGDAERGRKLSDWAESLESLPVDAVVVRGNGQDSGRALLEASLGSAEAVDEAIGPRPSAPSFDGPGDETTYLLSNQANARRLIEAIERLDAVRG